MTPFLTVSLAPSNPTRPGPCITNPADRPQGPGDSCDLEAARVLLALAVRELGIYLALHLDAFAAGRYEVQASPAAGRRLDLVPCYVDLREHAIAGV